MKIYLELSVPCSINKEDSDIAGGLRGSDQEQRNDVRISQRLCQRRVEVLESGCTDNSMVPRRTMSRLVLNWV